MHHCYRSCQAICALMIAFQFVFSENAIPTQINSIYIDFSFTQSPYLTKTILRRIFDMGKLVDTIVFTLFYIIATTCCVGFYAHSRDDTVGMIIFCTFIFLFGISLGYINHSFIATLLWMLRPLGWCLNVFNPKLKIDGEID